MSELPVPFFTPLQVKPTFAACHAEFGHGIWSALARPCRANIRRRCVEWTYLQQGASSPRAITTRLWEAVPMKTATGRYVNVNREFWCYLLAVSCRHGPGCHLPSSALQKYLLLYSRYFSKYYASYSRALWNQCRVTHLKLHIVRNLSRLLLFRACGASLENSL